MRKVLHYRAFLLVLACGAAWVGNASTASGGGMTPDMTSMAPGMMTPGLMGASDQGDAVEMGQRLGKFMGSFMREMKTSPERMESDDKSMRQTYREPRHSRDTMDDNRDNWRDYESDAPDRSRRGRANARDEFRDGREGRQELNSSRPPQYLLPTYDPWGAVDRGNPLLDYDSWGGPEGRSYNRPGSNYGGYRNPYNGGYGPENAADYNWNRGRKYYGAGLAPWESYDSGSDPYAERRWRDPSYYDPEYTPRYTDPGDGGYGPNWQPSPWSSGTPRRDYWW